MATIAIKAAKDSNIYICWSTISDTWCAIGTREEAFLHLREHDHPAAEAEHALQRADRNGSSDRSNAHFAWWDDDPVWISEGSPRDGVYAVPRPSMLAWAQAWIADDESAATALLVLIEKYDYDDTETDPTHACETPEPENR